MSKHYNLSFDTKLGDGIYVIRRIPCAWVACTSMLDTFFSGIPSKKQSHYQPVTNCTYWPVLGSYNNWNITHITPKSKPFEAFDEIHKFVLDGISRNTAALVQLGMYGAISTYYSTTNGLHVILFVSEAYMLQDHKQIDGQVIYTGELFVKAQYLCSVQ